jgi:hypothetical protein
MTPVKSESIAKIGYDAAAKRLSVQFKNGGVYHYAGIGPEQHAKLMAADSIGTHFQKHVRAVFKATKAKQ